MSQSLRPDEKLRWLDHARNVDRLVHGLYGLGALLFVADFAYTKHPHFALEMLFGFHAVYGFVACVVLVVLAKGLRRLLMRPETWYDDSPASGSGDAPR